MPVLPVRVESCRSIQFQARDTDGIKAQRRCLLLLQGIDIHHVLQTGDTAGDQGGAGFDQIALSRLQGLVMQPDQDVSPGVGYGTALCRERTAYRPG